jgi:hypothetical protein
MRDIMRLVFGSEEGILAELFGEADADADALSTDDADGFGMADRARRAGEWCGSTPGQVSRRGFRI